MVDREDNFIADIHKYIIFIAFLIANYLRTMGNLSIVPPKIFSSTKDLIKTELIEN